MSDNRKILEVVNGIDAFYIYHNPSGRCRGMGDGVDEGFYLPRLDEVVTLEDGEDVFTEAWQHDVEIAYLDYMDAYFHDLYELEIYESLDDLRELFVVAGPPDPRWMQLGMPRASGFTIYRYDDKLSAPMVAKIYDRWLEDRNRYRLVAYTDLSYDEQQAVAEALEEYEEAG